MSTAKAVYQQQLKTKTKALLDGTAVSTRAVYQPRSAKQNHIWRSCISPAHSINRDQSEIMSGARYLPRPISSMSSAAVSTRVMYQSRSAKQKQIRRSCISPARPINCDQRTESLSGAAVYQQQSAQQTPLRHRPADTCNIASTSVYQQWAAEPKSHLNHTTASIRAVNHPRSAKRIPAATSEQIM